MSTEIGDFIKVHFDSYDEQGNPTEMTQVKYSKEEIKLEDKKEEE